MELIVVFSTILQSNYFLVAIGLDRDGDGIVLMCAYVVVSGDVAVVLRMFVAVSSFHNVDCHVIMRRHRGGGMDECLLPCPLTS